MLSQGPRWRIASNPDGTCDVRLGLYVRHLTLSNSMQKHRPGNEGRAGVGQIPTKLIAAKSALRTHAGSVDISMHLYSQSVYVTRVFVLKLWKILMQRLGIRSAYLLRRQQGYLTVHK